MVTATPYVVGGEGERGQGDGRLVGGAGAQRRERRGLVEVQLPAEVAIRQRQESTDGGREERMRGGNRAVFAGRSRSRRPQPPDARSRNRQGSHPTWHRQSCAPSPSFTGVN